MQLSLFALVTCMACPGALGRQSTDHSSPFPDHAQAQLLPDHHPLWANAGNDLGAMASEQMLPQLTVVLARTAAQESALEKLLTEQQDPASPNYRHWLTPDEIGERFGPSPQEVEAVRVWLESAGLRVDWVAPSRIFIGCSGSAAEVSRAFHTEVHEYSAYGVKRYSVSSDPLIPAALAPVVRAVRGLYMVEEKPLHRFTALNSASPEVTAGGSHFMAPQDFAIIYDLPGGLDGAGEAIGIVGEARTNFADFSNFDHVTGAGVPNPTEIVPTAYGGIDPGPPFTAPPTGGASDGYQGEATLDVLRAGSIAPQAKLLLVVATPASGGIAAAAEYLVQTTPVPAQVMTISFGACESEAGFSGVSYWDGLFQQAAAEGISVFVSSGDSGASGCDLSFITPPANPFANSPNVICSSTYATCVGGTEFNDAASPSQYWNSSNGYGLSSALGYIPEGVWNEPLNSKSKSQVASSGGGVSKFIAIPSWQTGTGVPGARAGRYTPDIAFSAAGHDGYFACFAAGNGGCVNQGGQFYFSVFSGTSVAAPSMAGIATLLDENAGAAQGNLNPSLYQLASSAPGAFHDVTVSSSGVSGCSVNTPSLCNNSIPGTAGLAGGQAGFLVGYGYDEVTGLGSLDVSTFLNDYQNNLAPTIDLLDVQSPLTFPSLFVGYPESTRITVENSGSAIMNLLTVAISGADAGDFNQNNSCTSSLSPRGSCFIQLTFTPKAGGTRTAVLTLTSSNAANSPLMIQLSGTGSTTLLVPSVGTSVSSVVITPVQALAVDLTVFPPPGPYPAPTGSATLTSGAYTSPAAALSGGNATINVPAGSLAVGNDTLTITYTPDSQSASLFASASGTTFVTVGVVPAQMTETFSQGTITTAQAMTVGVGVSSYNGNPTPTGSVKVAGGGYTSAPATLAGGSASFSIPAGSLATGTYTLLATYTPDAASSSIYRTGSIGTFVTVTAPVPPSFTVSGTAVTLYPGAATGNTSTISIAPSGGFTGSVALTAAITSSPSGAQDPPTLSFGSTSPASISGASAGNAVLTITTIAAISGALSAPQRPWLTAGGAALAGLLFFWAPRRRRKWRTMLGMLALLAAFSGAVLACSSVQSGGGGGGGGNPGTTAGAYMVTVTGTSGSETQTAPVILTVQ